MLFAGLLFVYYGREEHFGYMYDYGILVLIISAALILWGIILAFSYLKCISNK